MLNDINIPGVEVIYFKSFQFRTKAWRVQGYNPSRPPAMKSKEYRLNINGFKAWKIGFKNRYQTPVTITLHYTVKGKILSSSYKETYSNLLSNMEAEMVVISGLKTGTARLDRIEVYSGSALLTRVEVNKLMPYWKGNSWLSFVTSSTLGLCFWFWHTQERNFVHNITTHWITWIAIILSLLDVYNITPVIIMLLLVLAAPFVFHDPVQLTTLLVLECSYVWAVWRKRASIKDLLIGAFIP
ncbi:hypothetical protein A4D02_00960 [Niastella koreensis]|uniref:Uncharacterized protein n=1 Tax=Niastella koreensis TaxID=354356 RepID=A0ABX3P421_9BACT|nr:hypothetical protein [Niastella koreensis]OQP54923.1 hypothetical protein A4D02_00960 [Niastella koreensis]